MANYKPGDIVESDKGAKVEILGVVLRSRRPGGRVIECYRVKILASLLPSRVGITDYKPVFVVDSNYVISERKFKAKPQTIAEYKAINLDNDLAPSIAAMREQFNAQLPSCDCGARKCGYSDHELHGHAQWCDIVKRTFRTPIIGE